MHGWQNPALIRGNPLQSMQNSARVSVCTFARYAMRQTGFSLDFCKGCNDDFAVQIIIPRWGKCCPRFWRAIPRWEFRARESVGTFTRWGKSCQKSKARFHPVGILCPESSSHFTPVGILCLSISSDFTPVGISCLRFG